MALENQAFNRKKFTWIYTLCMLAMGLLHGLINFSCSGLLLGCFTFFGWAMGLTMGLATVEISWPGRVQFFGRPRCGVIRS